MDGYDKLKSFGVAIHDAIDGFSRRIIWFKVSASNNNSKIIASHYLTCINKLKLIPRVVRGDHGSENVIVSGMQRFFFGKITQIIKVKKEVLSMVI